MDRHHPAELAIVVAAAGACLDPRFNLLGIQTTTGSATVAVIVHGPACGALAANAGSNCLGPGNRANACVGRAVHLALKNLGGAVPGSVDMATMGQPGKYTFCFAEGNSTSFLPFHVRRGFGVSQSAVTVAGVTGTVEVVPIAGGTSVESVLATMAGTMRVPGLLAPDLSRFGGGEQFILLPPELAHGLCRRDWTMEQIQAFLFDEGRVRPAGCSALGGGAAIEWTTNGPASAAIPVARGPNDIHLLVAGGPGVKMTYLPTWTGGTSPVTAAVPRL